MSDFSQQGNTCALMPQAHVGAVPSIPNAHINLTTIDKQWTSFWSSVRPIREPRTKNSCKFD